MNPNTNGEGASRIFKKKSSSRKASSPYHGKAAGNKRVRLPYECARCVFQLCEKLGHLSPSQTIEWLLNEAKSSVDVVLGAIPSDPAAATTVQAYNYPPSFPFVDVPPSPNQHFNSSPFAGFDLDQDIVKFLGGSY